MSSNFLCGSVAGLVTCSCVQPLDVIKTNLITLKKSMSILESARYVKEKYGMRGFWRGLQPAAYKGLIGSGMTFSYLEFLKSLLGSTGFLGNSAIGMVSRGLTIVSLSPLSVIKVRMEAPQVTGYKSVTEGLIKIYQEEGFRAYYKGLGSCLLRDLPFSGLSYGFYELFSEVIGGVLGTDKYNVYSRISSSILAGFTATLLTQPFDIIKTRQQFSHLAPNGDHQYKSILDAILKIYKNEGVKGFTIGLNVRLVERTTGFSVVWFIYERLKLFSNN